MSEIAAIENAPDEELVTLSLSKNRDAFAALIDRHRSLICSLAYSIVGNVDQSEDIAQETFILAWTKLEQLADPAKFRSWICGIARNTALGSIRKTRRIIRLAEKEQEASDPTPTDPADEIMCREEADLLWKSLERVPEKYREPLVLFYREDQSVSKVAAQLGLSNDAVKQRLSRGRAIVRNDIQRRLGEMLAATRPGPAFTAAVIGALPGVLVTSAAAAGTGGAIGAGKTAAAGLAGGATIGALGGMGGAALGWFAGDQTARYQSQRDLMKRSFIGSLILVAIFLSGGFYWKWGQNAPFLAPGVFSILWMLLFFAAIAIWSWRIGVKSRNLVRLEQEKGTTELPATPARNWLQKWEGRRWNSRKTLLGLPLVSIAFSDPDRDFTGINDFKSGIARGWIALGDQAYGLIAMGNIAVGGFAFGGMALGLVSFGGLAAGGIAFGGLTLAVLSLGGLALGIASLGGFSVGWWSFGGGAIGYRAAVGGFAAAKDYAIGGTAHAEHANDEMAKEFMKENAFFQLGMEYATALASPVFISSLMAITFASCAAMIFIGFKRKEN